MADNAEATMEVDKDCDTEDMKSEEDTSDDSSEEEGINETKVAELEGQLKTNPFHYDSHVELIKLLRQAGELEKLRSAREAMSNSFPLTEELWLEWLQDELKYMGENSSERDHISSLFEKAIQDYLSIPVWLEYVQFAIGGMAQPNGIQKTREVFEQAVTACGLHVSQGATIWEAYREFENAVLMGLQPTPGSVSTQEQESQLNAQMKRITTLFKRQLSVPLFDMEGTYGEYLEWCSGEPDQNIKAMYEKAKAKLTKLESFENALLQAAPPRREEYEAYLDYELKQKEPARIQCLFERALQENCLIAELWLKYTHYMEFSLKVGTLSLTVFERALRNCPWSNSLWLGYARALERHSRPHGEVVSVFERALTAGMTQATDFLELWLAYCDYLRRRISWDEQQEESLELLRTTFDRAVEHIYTYFPEDGDPQCSLLQYWARIEANKCKNLEKMRDLWGQIMQAGHAHEAQMWLEYLNIERAYGDAKHCRKLLQKAVNSVSDWPESVCEAYINFEREEGTLEQYDQAVQRVAAQLERVKERREKAAEKEAALSEQKKQNRKEKQAIKKAEKQQQKQATGQKQQQLTKSFVKASEQRGEENDKERMDDGFKVPPPPSTLKPGSKPTTQEKPKSAPPPGYKRKSAPPPGFKPPPVSQDSSEPPTKRSKGTEEMEMKEVDESGDHHANIDPNKTSCTAFISNLNYEVDEQHLQEVFSEVGEITQIRLVKNYKGKSKGFAYVVFKDEFAAKEALKLDRKPLDGRPMFVSECKEGGGGQKFKYKTSLEKNKLFVRGLPFTCTEEALKTIFSAHGPIKDIRLVTYRSGAFKGLAYVEYVNENDASNAVLKTDGLVIGEHTISVAISNPPERKTPTAQRDTLAFTPTLGSGKKDFGVRGKAHTQLSLLPRNVSRGQQQSNTISKPAVTKPADKTQDNKEAETDTKKDGKMMSNEDFRKMLLNR